MGHHYKITTEQATLNKSGSVKEICETCGEQGHVTAIAFPKTIKLSKTAYVYNGKVCKPSVAVQDSAGKKLASKDAYTVSYPLGMKEVGVYTVSITFKGNYSGTVQKTYTINPKKTSLLKISAKTKGFTVKWKKQKKQTTGYQLQYSTSKRFKSGVRTVTVKRNKIVSKSVSNLKTQKKYFVRIRCYKKVKVNGKNKKIYSGWSKARAVTTKK